MGKILNDSEWREGQRERARVTTRDRELPDKNLAFKSRHLREE